MRTALFPSFSSIQPRHVMPALKKTLADNAKCLACCLSHEEPTWQNLMVPLALMDQAIHRVWSPVSHLNAVCHAPAWQKVYEQGVTLLTAYETEMAHHVGLYQAVQRLAKSEAFQKLTQPQQMVIHHMLRDFTLAGVHLSVAKKKQVKQVEGQLGLWSAKFSANALAATNAWYYHVKDEAMLAGLPPTALQTAKQLAQSKKQKGYGLSLQMPCYLAVMEYANSRELRAMMYRAKVSECSSFGDKRWNNEALVVDILKGRKRLAGLLGYSTYSECALATRMAKDTKTVLDFLQSLVKKAMPKAKHEMKALTAFAKTHCQISDLQPWDLAYVSRVYREHHFSISQELMRPYFPESKVFDGLCGLLKRLYGIRLVPKHGVSRCHPSVKVFAVMDRQQKPCGYLIMDLYARSNKRSGAWMDECQQRWRDEKGELHLPVAHVVANFNPPVGRKPAYFTHDDLLTLFHEMGHALHHVLTEVDEAAVSGINGVPWDAVECPSQWMENWCWDYAVLRSMSAHQETKKAFPKSLFEKLQAGQQMLGGMRVVRQCELAWFDMLVHSHKGVPSQRMVLQCLEKVRAQTALLQAVPYNRFHCTFSHIFAGGYSAGYYSYLWAEVMSLDAFECIKSEGRVHLKEAKRFRETILARGGSEPFMDLYERFRGRPPKMEALLRHYGLHKGK